MRLLNLGLSLLAAVTITGCASGLGGGDYERTEARRVMSVRMGLAGAAAEESMTRKQGIEVTLKMDNGELLAIVQEDGGENFAPGERVRLLQDGRNTRVTR